MRWRRIFKSIFLSFAVFCLAGHEEASAVASQLTQRIELAGFGQIAFRPPLEGSMGTPILLLQGIFAGSTHRHMREIRDLLDAQGRPVFTLDLPGTGESDSQQVVYDFPLLTRFVTAALTEIVGGRAIVVAEQMMGLAALEAARADPNLFEKIVFIGPTGALYLKDPPTAGQDAQFARIWSDDAASIGLYQRFVGENSARYYLGLAYFDPAQVTDERVSEITETGAILGQRWITLSFVFGRIHHSFAEAVAGVNVPLTIIIGAETRSLVSGGAPENIDVFRGIAPDLHYVVVGGSGGLPHREKPEIILGDI